MTKIVKKLF